MKQSAPLKREWVLNQEGFDRLLASLDPDLEAAGAKYEHIRRALITFFECRGSRTPEDQADDTINRVARRLLEGQVVQSDTVTAYFYGVARNVLKEYWDARSQMPESMDGPQGRHGGSADSRWLDDRAAEQQLTERRLDCLERCLAELPPADRDLIAQYYRGETSAKIANRRRMAEERGIPLNALRIRTLRIREKLEACVLRRLGVILAAETSFASRHRQAGEP